MYFLPIFSRHLFYLDNFNKASLSRMRSLLDLAFLSSAYHSCWIKIKHSRNQVYFDFLNSKITKFDLMAIGALTA
jgi:hypothetical protein